MSQALSGTYMSACELRARGSDQHVNLSAQTALRTPAPLIALASEIAPRAVVFDLDGTLVDTMPILADLASSVMSERFGITRERARELYLSTCGIPFADQLEAIYPEDPRNAEAADTFESAKPARCGDARMSRDTVAVLDRLRRRGLFLAISSNNGSDNVDRFVEENGYPFEMALGYGAGLRKGEPHFDRLCEAFDLGRHDLVFVGVTGTFSREQFALLHHPAQRVINRLTELPAQI